MSIDIFGDAGMMSAMRSSDARDDLANGIDAAPLPRMAPDGGLELEPAKKFHEAPPTLCQAGPCRNYHCFRTEIDAQDPLAERRDGKLIIHKRVFHTVKHHYCYPTVGIETVLGSEPVLDCNKWVPITRLFQRRSSVRRDYERRLADWQAGLDAEADETIVQIGTPIHVVVWITETSDQPVGPVIATSLQTVYMETSMRALVQQVVDSVWGGNLPDKYKRHRPTIGTEDGPIDNLDATMGQLGIADDARIRITLLPPKETP